MPSTLTYPGVYIEEVSSGVRSIAGVATSIAAFVGWAPKGPTDRAVRVKSWGDFDRQFGGLDVRSKLGFAVYQFFSNGGQDAYIVRLADSATAASATVTLDSILKITANGQGKWGNAYSVTVKSITSGTNRFRLTVSATIDGVTTVVEAFESLSMDVNDARCVTGVVNNSSALIEVQILGTPSVPPSNQTAPLAGGLDGTVLNPNDAAFDAALCLSSGTTGLMLLDRIDLFNLLCIPGETNAATIQLLEDFCYTRRAFLIADSVQGATVASVQSTLSTIGGSKAVNAALYFPWVKAPNPLKGNAPEEFPPCGFVAGLYAQTDTQRGVWKAPAGVDASLTGVLGPTIVLTDGESGTLNPLAVNCLRAFPVYGTVVWGARTLRGNNELGSEWKYVPVRRTALFIEETLFRATKWVVFEPNDEPLWAQIRLNIGAFLHGMFRQGAFQGQTPKDAYFVKCDHETTTQADINLGVVNILVGFAPLKPAEFVVIKLQQIAGQIQS